MHESIQELKEGSKVFARSKPSRSIPQSLMYSYAPDVYVVPLFAGHPPRLFVDVEVAADAMAVWVVVTVMVAVALIFEEFAEAVLGRTDFLDQGVRC